MAPQTGVDGLFWFKTTLRQITTRLVASGAQSPSGTMPGQAGGMGLGMRACDWVGSRWAAVSAWATTSTTMSSQGNAVPCQGQDVAWSWGAGQFAHEGVAATRTASRAA